MLLLRESKVYAMPVTFARIRIMRYCSRNFNNKLQHNTHNINCVLCVGLLSFRIIQTYKEICRLAMGGRCLLCNEDIYVLHFRERVLCLRLSEVESFVTKFVETFYRSDF